MSSVRMLGVLALSLCTSAPAASLTVMNWNVANHPNDGINDASLSAILAYAGAAGRVDLLTLAETDTANNSLAKTVIAAGATFGGTYASLATEADGGGDRNAFVYNTSTLTLVGHAEAVGVGTLTHPALRARFRPVGTSGTDDFFAYSVHLDSGTTAAVKNRRVSQAQVIRQDADARGSTNLIVAGDFNWQKADDVSPGVGAYRTLNAPGTGQVADPVGQVGDWRGNPVYGPLFTNDPGSGLDDRFDMQLVGQGLLDRRGLDYTPGSYRVLGNAGTATVGGTVYDNAALPAGLAAAFDDFSDHLPVLAGYIYRIPGDVDGNDAVDFADFIALQSVFGQTVTDAPADLDYSGTVNFADFILLQSNFGTSLPGGRATFSRDEYAAVMGITDAAQVPEPAAFAMLGMAAAGLLRRRALRSRHVWPPHRP